MTAVVDVPVPAPPAVNRSRSARGSLLRWVVLTVCGVYFLVPLAFAFWFTVRRPRGGGVSGSAYSQLFTTAPNGQFGIGTALLTSLGLAAVTIVITLLLMVPTQLLLHLRYPRVRPVVEVLSLLPLVFPPVVLVVGVSDTFTWTGDHLTGPLASLITGLRDPGFPVVLALLYVVLALPFAYRALDAGIRSIDAHTLTEAAQNLGAGWPAVVWRVVLPSLRTAVVNAAFLCFALVMGEYTIASILLYTKPFPVWLVQLPTTSGQVQVAASVLSLLVVELLLLLIGALNWRRAARHGRTS
ncbi:ABC transporter permease subunit [Modestobacter sp. NPDC049651]|uniref:ABC transporter permease n=1 Tax=unclassified Modestobacter TaxID=2643866 RepID=UPI0033D8E0AE